MHDILSAQDLLRCEGAVVQILNCKRKKVALGQQLSEHCIQLLSVTTTTHNIGNVQAQLTHGEEVAAVEPARAIQNR
jgi:hypothetical protein